ncbi:CoA transferase, partial [Burkholderia sola]|uniref:CoA transferase n=1 Tax=Burkholderia sola TaxID=2843302 RepID=UPI0023DDACCE
MNDRQQAAALPYAGVRVIEMTHMVMGPTCGMLLADLGAEVIKIEPIAGDSTRALRGSGAGFFGMFNRNKAHPREAVMTVTPKVIVLSSVATLVYLGLAVLGSGGFAAFFSHPQLTVVAIATLVMAVAALFTEGNLSSGERENRDNRWVLAAFGVSGFLLAYLPALTDRFDVWT